MSIHPEQQLQCQNITVIINQPLTGRSMGHSSDVTITLGCRDAGRHIYVSHSREVTRYHGVMGSHYRHTEQWTLLLYRISSKAVPFDTVKLRIETYMLRDVSIVRSGCISHVTLSFVWFLSFRSQTHGTAAQSYLTERNHRRTKLCDWESCTIDKYRQAFWEREMQ